MNQEATYLLADFTRRDQRWYRSQATRKDVWVEISLRPAQDGLPGYALEDPMIGKMKNGHMGKRQKDRATMLSLELRDLVTRTMMRAGWYEIRPFVWTKA